MVAGRGWRLWSRVGVLLVVVPVLIGVAFFTVVERQGMSATQRRLGPRNVGDWGRMQAFADGLKLRMKETIVPTSAAGGLLLGSPVRVFSRALTAWAVIPVVPHGAFADVRRGMRVIFAVSSLSVYGVIIGGWASNSKYAFLGARRSAAQMISYEVSIGFIIVGVLLCAGTRNRSGVVQAQEGLWYAPVLWPVFFRWGVSVLAETNRHPFDLPEAEAELVSGYNVEYSSMGFARYFLGEYSNMLMMSAVTTVLFLGGSYAGVRGTSARAFGLKAMAFAYIFVRARAAYPRFRYDQRMRLGWKVYLPISIGVVLFVSLSLLQRDGLVGGAGAGVGGGARGGMGWGREWTERRG